MLNYTAIDFETANSDRGSVCAVGLAQVRDGKLLKTVEWYVQPPTGIDKFDDRNIQIHGITPDMVRAAATWSESVDEILALAEDYPLVAFNAAFDSSVVTKSSALAGIAPPTNPFYCALKLSRRLMNLDQYKLPLVAKELDLPAFNHHDAGNDAETCAQVVLALSERHNLRTMDALWTPSNVAPRTGTMSRPNAFSKASRVSIADLPQPNPDADPSHPFFGRQIIITGELDSYSRWDAAEAIAHVGGTNGKGVTKKTSFLVVGDGRTHDQIVLELGTSKEQKAAAYIGAGQNIRVLTEPEFVALVAGAGTPTIRIDSDESLGAIGIEANEAEQEGSWLHEPDFLETEEIADLSPRAPFTGVEMGVNQKTVESEEFGARILAPGLEKQKTQRVSKNTEGHPKTSASSAFVLGLLIVGVFMIFAELLAR